MCGGSAPTPTPTAPAAPVPVRDTKIDAKRSQQDASRRADQTGYRATLLTGAGGDTSKATTASPVLGG